MARKKAIKNSQQKSEPDQMNDMLEPNTKNSSKNELLQAIQQMNKPSSLNKTIKSPNQILKFIEENNESIETLALKAEVSEREILLAIRDSNDTATRKKIAEALNTTYYSIFGK